MPVYSMPIITWLSACKNFMVNPKPSKPYNKATDPITLGASVYIKNYFPKSSWEEWRVLKILNSQDPSNLLLHSTNFKLCLIINASFYHLLQSRLKRRLSAWSRLKKWRQTLYECRLVLKVFPEKENDSKKNSRVMWLTRTRSVPLLCHHSVNFVFVHFFFLFKNLKHLQFFKIHSMLIHSKRNTTSLCDSLKLMGGHHSVKSHSFSFNFVSYYPEFQISHCFSFTRGWANRREGILRGGEWIGRLLRWPGLFRRLGRI